MAGISNYIAVDWGTTNRRAYRVDDGRHGAEVEDARGILAIPEGDFPDAVAEIRQRLGNLPLLMAGMVGSNRGWVEAPYVPAPAGLAEIAARLVWAEPGRAAIVPGVSYRDGEAADVMRGEEVQLLGAAATGLIAPDALACHPGTHNKWVRLAAGRIAAFRTVMTGEMFQLLKDRSILADLLQAPAEVDDAFRDGVRRGLEGAALTADLFSARARMLLGTLDRTQGASWVSGLLIGADLRTGTAGATGEVAVVGRPELTARYAAALAVAGIPCREVDGEQAFLAGIGEIARRL